MIFIVGATCERCGTPLKIEEPNATGDAFFERHNGDHLVTLCKNAQMCAERRRGHVDHG